MMFRLYATGRFALIASILYVVKKASNSDDI